MNVKDLIAKLQALVDDKDSGITPDTAVWVSSIGMPGKVLDVAPYDLTKAYGSWPDGLVVMIDNNAGE